MTMVKNFEYIKLYVLKEYDGADGRYNTPSGFITKDRACAEAHVKKQNGNDFQCVEGILISHIDEIKEAENELKKIYALSKLTEEEKQLLGLIKPANFRNMRCI